MRACGRLRSGHGTRSGVARSPGRLVRQLDRFPLCTLSPFVLRFGRDSNARTAEKLATQNHQPHSVHEARFRRLRGRLLVAAQRDRYGYNQFPLSPLPLLYSHSYCYQ